MSLASSFELKEEIRQAIDIVSLVGDFLPLRRQGRIYTAVCPWHEDHRPSLQVNPERQTFRCWVCDIGGDIFTFVMKREGVTFPEALAMLAERAGIDIRRRAGGGGGGGPATQSEGKQVLYRAMAWAEEQFHKCLLDDPAAEPARRYLEARKITPESIRRFRLGFSPDQWQWLTDRAAGTPHTPDILEKVGLTARGQTGRTYDRFKGRLLFPIRDEQGKPIAVGGRVLPELEPADRDVAKYVNSPETPLFSKSRRLYALDIARDAVMRSRHVVVVEGYTDCIIAAQSGLDNVVAVLGTALGEGHVKLLKRYADTVTLVLDGDEAGQKRANEILDLFIAGQLDLRVLTLPDRLDPCDYLLERGADEFRRAVEQAVDALEHKLRTATRGLDPGGGTHEANVALEEMLETLAKAPRLQAAATSTVRLRENQFLARLAREFRVSEEAIRDRLAALRRRSSSPPAQGPDSAGQAQRTTRSRWERELVEVLIQVPDAAGQILAQIRPDDVEDHIFRQVLTACGELAQRGMSTGLEQLLTATDDPDMHAILVELDESGRQRGGNELADQLPELLARFRQKKQDRRLRAAAAALQNDELDEREQLDKLQEVIQQKRGRQGISEPTDG